MLVAAATLSSCGQQSSPTAPKPTGILLTVQSMDPVPGATDVSVTTTFTAKLTGPIDPATATTGSFTVFEGASPVRGRVTASDSTVTFTPLMPLRTATTYTAAVTTALRSKDGSALASARTWDATTKPGQPLGGIISASTTLSLSGSPYALTSNVQVAYGATLTLEPGVVLDGGGGRIEVFGSLAATGTPIQPVTLHDVRVVPGANTPAQPFAITLQHALVHGGRLYEATGNACYGSLVLRDSRLVGLQEYLYLWYPVADCYIERNVFTGCGGLSVGTNDAVKVYVRNNVFHAQTGGYAVENWASYLTSETIIALNSFLSTDRLALSLPAGYSSAKLSATNNYWGTTSAGTINTMIFDQNDDLGSNAVIPYQPILTSPDVATPDPAPWISPGP
jgi:hypothetical protein